MNSSVYFRDERRPQGTRLVGAAALIDTLDLNVPVRTLSCVSTGHVYGNVRTEHPWQVYDKRYDPGTTLAGNLEFMLRHEQLDLLVLKGILLAMPRPDLDAYVRATPTGIYTRRAWFFFEFFSGDRLDLPDLPSRTAKAVDVLDPKAYVTTAGTLSSRHRVRDNLLGTSTFCPLVRRTPKLAAMIQADLAATAQATVGRTSRQLLTRVANALLLADSRASFDIEGERPPQSRLERWGRAVMQSGRHPLTLAEIERLQQVIIEDDRFVQLGLRRDGVFLGEHSSDGEPLPEFIGARPEDLPSLMKGLIHANERMRAAQVDPVVQAAATAFGFVYVHPLVDGNGRVHRCLMHHVLAERGFTPPGVVFPVSTVMLDRIEDYRTTLREHSAPLMPHIDWRPTQEGNVHVLHDTSDLYRFYDCTAEAEFLYECVRRTVLYDFPREVAYMEARERAVTRINAVVDMPGRLVDLFLLFVRQHGGSLPRGRRLKEFAKLTDDEVAQLEAAYREAFAVLDDQFGDPPGPSANRSAPPRG